MESHKDEFPEFRKTIIEQCTNWKKELEMERKKDKIQLVLDFSMLKEYMDKGGLILQTNKMSGMQCTDYYPNNWQPNSMRTLWE